MSQCLSSSVLSVSGLGLALTLVYIGLSPIGIEQHHVDPVQGPSGNVAHDSETRKASTTPLPAESPKPPFSWASLESDDYRQYLTNLMSVGCPPQIRADIILAEIRLYYQPREAPLRARIAELQIEESQVGSTVEAAQGRQRYVLQKQLRAVELEKQAVVRELLGIVIPLEPIRTWHPRTYERYEAAIASLPPEQRERVREVIESYWLASDELNDRHQLQRNTEYLDAYRRLNVERKARLAQVLSPTQLDEYEMRTTGIANRVSAELAGVDVSEDEFRQIASKRTALDAPYGGSVRVDMTVDGETPDYHHARQELEGQVAEVLGPERFEAYMLNRDPAFQEFLDLGLRFNLPRETLQEAFQLWRPDGTPRSGSAAPNLPEGSSSARADSMTRMRELLGDEALTALQRRKDQSLIEWFLPPNP